MKEKAVGFYVSVAVAVLSLLAIGLYFMGFNGTKYMSMEAVWLVLAGVVISIVLSLAKKDNAVPAVLLACVFVSMLRFISAVYLYVVTSVYAASVIHFSTEFSGTIICYVLAIVIGIVNVFLKQRKEAAAQ